MNVGNDLEVTLEGLDALGISKCLYSKELNTKKNIMEFIEIVKNNKDKLDEKQIQEIYTYIYKSIDKMGEIIKPNTVMYLKNILKSQLGKFVREKDPKEINYFIEFFKEAYPKNFRRKDFTWVLMDIKNISDEQIWNTLVYINGLCIKEKRNLKKEEREDIIQVINLLIKHKNVKYINQLKSLETLLKALKIRVIGIDKWVEIKSL